MEQIDNVRVTKDSHSLQIRIYPKIVTVTVIMPMAEYANYIHLGISAERKAIHNRLRGIFCDDYKGQTIFYEESEFRNYLKKYNITLQNGECFFKTLAFEILQEDFENSLNGIISHIKTKSEDFERKKAPNKEGIVKNILGKYFGKK